MPTRLFYRKLAVAGFLLTLFTFFLAGCGDSSDGQPIVEKIDAGSVLPATTRGYLLLASPLDDVLQAMQAENKTIQWETSYVVQDKTFCIYIADSEALIHEHAERSGFPASIVSEVKNVIDPVTAEA